MKDNAGDKFRFSLQHLLAFTVLAAAAFGAIRYLAEVAALDSILPYLLYVGFFVGVVVSIIGFVIAKVDDQPISLKNLGVVASIMGIVSALILLIAGWISYTFLV